MHGVEFAILLHRALEARVQELYAAASGEVIEGGEAGNGGEGGFTDPEVLHRTRVACRRLWALLDLLDPETYSGLGPRAKALRRFAKDLGPVREFDMETVGLLNLHAKPENRPHQAALEHLLEIVARRRRKALAELPDKLPNFNKLLRVPSLPEPFQGPVVAQGAWACLKPRIEEALATIGERREEEDVAALHESRVDVKRLRDTLEALIPAFSVAPVGFVAELKAMQKTLGDHHDLASLEAFLSAQQDHLAKAGRPILASSLMDLRDQVADARRKAFEAFKALDGPWDSGEFSARVQALLGVSTA